MLKVPAAYKWKWKEGKELWKSMARASKKKKKKTLTCENSWRTDRHGERKEETERKRKQNDRMRKRRTGLREADFCLRYGGEWNKRRNSKVTVPIRYLLCICNLNIITLVLYDYLPTVLHTITYYFDIRVMPPPLVVGGVSQSCFVITSGHQLLKSSSCFDKRQGVLRIVHLSKKGGSQLSS